MPKVQGDLGSTGDDSQPVKTEATQRAGGIHIILKAARQQSLPSNQGRTKAAEWQGAQGKRQPARHLCSARAAGRWGQRWGLAPGDSREGCPHSEAGCDGMHLAPFIASLEMTAGSQRGDTIALYCGQELAMAATLKGCKSVCIIISWVCMLVTCHIWSPEKDLPLLFCEEKEIVFIKNSWLLYCGWRWVGKV